MSPITTQPAQGVAVVWLKRDLRLTDHTPLCQAIASGHPLVLLYIVEPMLQADPHYDLRHWRFIWQSLQALNQQLQPFQGQLTICQGDALDMLTHLHQNYGIHSLYSHEETGLRNTFERDLAVARWCQQRQITWQETPSGAVIRAARNRLHWDKHWQQVMRAPLAQPDLQQARFAPLTLLPPFTPPPDWLQRPPPFQPGGPVMAWRYWRSFLAGRGKQYSYNMSRPQNSRTSCSRLSPYLAWGNISLRELYQAVLAHWQRPGWRRALQGLVSRLHWHCHFIQKFESECRMEFEPVNRGYLKLDYKSGPEALQWLDAWQRGQTGIPLVDACMRCLQATGYLNFRMRAMLVSVL
ncbi:MAG: deoxyribodipyrimidine photo-lyase, partial [Porticoccaceae bacterium]|nr:deoxyribodipyrimidine photo-lyase [Porticoccaceae bacterium]